MSEIKKAIILAAGRGNRIRPRTDTIHKCLIPIQGTTIIHRLLKQLSCYGISQVVIVTGHLSDLLKQEIGSKYEGMAITYLLNKEYLTTNNIISLQIAKQYLNESILLFEADLIIDELILAELLASPHEDAMVVDQFRENMDGTVVSLNNNEKVIEMLLKKDQFSDMNISEYYKTVNIYKFSQKTAQKLASEIDNAVLFNGCGSYYEVAISNLIRTRATMFYAILPKGLKWIEIDTESDLERAYSLFDD